MKPAAPITLPVLTDEERAAFYPKGGAVVRTYDRITTTYQDGSVCIVVREER